MDIVSAVTLLCLALSIGVKVVGMPDQILSNYRRKSTTGLSGWFIVSTLISYVLWVVHGLQVHDEALVIGQGLGAVVTIVIVVQMIQYRQTSGSQKSRRTFKPPLLWFSAMQ